MPSTSHVRRRYHKICGRSNQLYGPSRSHQICSCASIGDTKYMGYNIVVGITTTVNTYIVIYCSLVSRTQVV